MINIGAIIDNRYEVIREIDRGGMSIIYIAHDKRLNKDIVIKEILPAAERKTGKRISDEDLLDCLKQEWKLLVALDHHSLPNISDVIDKNGHIYVVMDYIPGESLIKKLNREGKCSPEEVIDWGIQLSRILDYLHTGKREPVIYRDMKPDNIMLTPNGQIKLIDFGTAISEDVEIDDSNGKSKNYGTKEYAAPEQKKQKITNEKTDIFSLGVTLYKLVIGGNIEDNTKLPPIREIDPSLPEGLEYILEKCLKINPEERYDSAADLLYDLENINKLTRDYRKKIVKQMSLFIVSLILFFVSSGVTIWGYSELKSEKLNNYKSIINEATYYLADGNYSKSIEILNKAITTVDSSEEEAYNYLLDVYIAMGDVTTGLNIVEGYINDKYGNIHKNNDVLFKVAMTYLDNKNYPMALKYFNKVNSKRIPDAKYYSIISSSMSNMNIDYVDFQMELEEFEEYVDTLANGERKLANYNSLANIYSSYKGQINNANDKIIRILDKADLTLQNIDDKQITLKYEVELCQKLAQAYHSKGSNSNDKETAREFFNKAINLYNELLDLEVKNSEDIFIKIGDIYTETKEYSSAVEQYEKVINKYPSSIKGYSKLISVLLDIEQEKEYGQDYSKVKEYYNTASQINGSDDNEEFKKVKRRLNNLEII